MAYGLRTKNDKEETGLIYSRINNPNLEILENRLCLWDKSEDCAVFESGMSAISTVLLEFLNPGDLLLYSQPTYGGTDHFITHFLEKIGVHSIGFLPDQNQEEIVSMIESSGKADKLALIYVETPANPTNALIDVEMCKAVSNYFKGAEKSIPVAVDNTYMGPLWSAPLEHGADLVIYSATKYIGGHSDLIAGAVLGNSDLLQRIKILRTFLGNMASPHTCWLLLRSLETLKVRMEQQAITTQYIAEFLQQQPKIKRLHYLGALEKGSKLATLHQRQYRSAGAMLAFELKGGEEGAFLFLNKLRLIKLAVSLGGTESLAQHPATMTHAGVDPVIKERLGINSGLIRLSVGLEHHEDLIKDINNALQALEKT